MNEIYTQLITYALGVWRRRWYVITIAWLFCGAGWTFVSKIPDKYASTARIYVDMDTMLGPLMKGIAVETNLSQQIEVMRRTLLSRPNLEKVMLMTDLDLTYETEEEKEILIEKLGKTISISRQGRNINLFEVAFSDNDAVLTKRVVQAVLQIFVESNVGASRKDMATTEKFLNDQLLHYETQLIQAENRRAEFKRRNMGFMPGGGNYFQRMQAMLDKVERTENEFSEESIRAKEMTEQLSQVPQYLKTAVTGTRQFDPFGATGPGPMDDTLVRIYDLEAVIANLMSSYTAKHPDVVTAQKRLDALRKKHETEQDEIMTAMGALMEEQPDNGRAPTENLVSNPIYEQIKLQLVHIKASIAALEVRLERERNDVEKWKKMARLVPSVEAELLRLDRDYGIVKRAYEQLRNRKESALLARELETNAHKVKFRIIDPPKVPLKPIGPNRPLLMSVVLGAGIAAGIAFAVLLGQINATFSTVERLRNRFSLPILGSISALRNSMERRRRKRELSAFAFVGLSLLFAYSGLLLIHGLGAGWLVDNIKGLGII